MFWPKDHIFNCFKQIMLFSWFGSVISLIVTMTNQNKQIEDNLSCGNQTDFQLLSNIMCESARNRGREFTQSKEQCYINVLCFILNISIVISTLTDWFKVKFLRKWFSFDYLLNVIYLLAFHGWAHLNDIEFHFTIYYRIYLGLIVFQSLLALIYEYNYYNRYLTYDFILDDPMFDPKIISYSNEMMVYMCGYLTANKLPQSKWAALAYQSYKYLLICVAQLSIMIIIWYFIGLDCDHLVYGERCILLLSCLLFFTLIIIWKRDTKSPKVTYIFLSTIFIILIINLLQKIISTDQLYNLSIYLTVMIGVMLTSILALKFCRSFKEHRAYSELFYKEFRKLLFQVYEQCRNKEYFMIKYNFKIKYKCCVCGTLAVDLVCNQCYAAVFDPKK